MGRDFRPWGLVATGGALVPTAEEAGMAPRVIGKDRAAAVAANLVDDDAERAAFSWEQARAALDGLPAGGLNIAYEAVDQHVAHSRATSLPPVPRGGRA